MLASWPAAGPTLAFFKLFLSSANAALSGFLLLGVLDPADKLVARQGCYVIPGGECRGVGDQGIAQISGQLMHHAARQMFAHAGQGNFPRRGLAPVHPRDDGQGQRGPDEPGGRQEGSYVRPAGNHCRATALGGLRRVGDGPLGGNSGECRESADQKVGVGGCLEFAWHRAGADGGHRHTGARDLGVHRLREGG